MKEFTAESLPEGMTLKEVCDRCVVDAETVIRYVDYGIVDPQGDDCARWTFTAHGYLRIRKALRLQRDLALNAPGVALAIDLLDQLDSANREIRQLRKLLGEED